MTGAYQKTSAQQHSDVSILQFGASNQGKQRIDSALTHAIHALTQQGGGTINFPSGIYYTGPIELESHIFLNLQRNARLIFTTDSSDYRKPGKRSGQTEWLPLIRMNQITDAGISGSGCIDGQENAWGNASPPKTAIASVVSTADPVDSLLPASRQPMIIPADDPRPSLIQIVHSRGILLEGIELTNVPNTAIEQTDSRRITLRNIRIENPDSTAATGIRSESCSNIQISAAQIESGGDGIEICSSDTTVLPHNGTSGNIIICDCRIENALNGIRFENTSGHTLSDISVNNCLILKSEKGLKLDLSPDKEAYIQNLQVNDLIMDSIKEAAFQITIHQDETNQQDNEHPLMKNVHFSNITGQAGQAGIISGNPAVDFGELTMANIDLTTNLGLSIKGASGISIETVIINNSIGPSLLVHQTKNLNIHNFCTNTPQPQTPVIHLDEASEIHIFDCFQSEPTFVFVEEEKNSCSAIYLSNNILDQVETPVLIH